MLKHRQNRHRSARILPAAFRRLCVETLMFALLSGSFAQPPSGGCVLKPYEGLSIAVNEVQPPSGGCVLKLQSYNLGRLKMGPAAFRRLCVETDADLRICNT